MNFFIDRTCSKQLIDVMAPLSPGVTFVHLNERFPQDAKEVIWVPAVASWPGQWCVVSGDAKRVEIREKLRVLRGTSLTWFAFVGVFMNSGVQAQKEFVKAVWPSVLETAIDVYEPAVYKVHWKDGVPTVRLFATILDL